MTRILKELAISAALLSVTTSGAYSKDIIAEPSNGTGAAAGASTDARAVRSSLADALDPNKDARSRCEALQTLGTSRDEAVLLVLANTVRDPDMGVRVCASRLAGETKNARSVDMLRANIESYLKSPGPNKNASDSRLAAINSIWSLGEIGDPALMNDLVKFYKSSDNTFKINDIISIGKLAGNAGAFLKKVSASPDETETVRTAAFEMLDELGQSLSIPGLPPSKSAGIADGDIIFAGGLTGDITSWVSPDTPVGHAGIFAGAEIKDGRMYITICDCVPNFFDPGGVRNIRTWKNFTHQFKYPYYGNRTTSPAPTPAQRKKIVELALEMGKKGLKYDISHISQKGPVEFDCVGYTEYLYEAAGLNPTDNSYETGWGWPLTPWEQYSGTVPDTAQAPAHSGAAAFAAAPKLPFAAAEMLKKGLFGVGGELIEAPSAIAPAIAD